jgi:hypothetical protein
MNNWNKENTETKRQRINQIVAFKKKLKPIGAHSFNLQWLLY